MGKSILLFFAGKPFGVFSNKTNAWMAVAHNYEVDKLCVYSEKKQEYLPASYSMLAARLGKIGKCHIFKRDEIAEAATAELGEKKATPAIYVYQFDTNVANDGLLYKSSDKSEKSEEVGEAEDDGGCVQIVNPNGDDGNGGETVDNGEGDGNPAIPEETPDETVA